jgi:hypothetical protein
MCSTCAFKDPTAYRDDPELRVKIRQALALESPFVCHEGFEQDEQGRYIIPRLPDGSEDKSRMKECRGISEALLRRYDLELKRESREAIP